MRKTSLCFLILFSVVVITACNTTDYSEQTNSNSETTEATAVSESTNTDSGMMGMGMGGSMRDRHHAPIPEEYASLSNPITADVASRERGADIYASHCATCHGDGGVGDGPASKNLNPAPANIAHTSQMMGDPYLFYRISEGGGFAPFNSSMIAWKGILDEQARWDVINYVQALGQGTVTPRQHTGGTNFDPSIEADKQAEMLATAVEQEIITQAEADTFAHVHEFVDARMVEIRRLGTNGNMDDLLSDILSDLVESNTITQEEADTFLLVHDRLGDAGLMQ